MTNFELKSYYSSQKINDMNKFLYSNVENVFEESGLADFFTKIEPLQIALAKKTEQLIHNKKIRLEELGSGTDLTRWEIISGLKSSKKWEVILTDFSENTLPDVSKLNKKGNYSFVTKKLNLLDKLIALNPEDKVDVILATYTFDSIWFSEDLHIEKKLNKWFYTIYKLSSLKNIKDINGLAHVKIEKKLIGLDMAKHVFGNLISEYYSHKKNIKINFPGGLISKVEEAFGKQIATNGIFIIGDMAVNNTDGLIPATTAGEDPIYMEDYATSGKVAKFKVEDYGLAKKILETLRYKVELETVEQFIKNSGYKIPLEVKDHWIMIVRR